MAADPRVQQRIEDVLDTERTPEELRRDEARPGAGRTGPRSCNGS